METELDILKLADYSERFTEGEASAYLIVNKNITAHPCMFGFEKLPENFETYWSTQPQYLDELPLGNRQLRPHSVSRLYQPTILRRLHKTARL